jgi:hypothetical protein
MKICVVFQALGLLSLDTAVLFQTFRLSEHDDSGYKYNVLDKGGGCGQLSQLMIALETCPISTSSVPRSITALRWQIPVTAHVIKTHA